MYQSRDFYSQDRHRGQELPLRTWQSKSSFMPLKVMIRTPWLGVGWWRSLKSAAATAALREHHAQFSFLLGTASAHRHSQMGLSSLRVHRSFTVEKSLCSCLAMPPSLTSPSLPAQPEHAHRCLVTLGTLLSSLVILPLVQIKQELGSTASQ